MLGKKKLIEKTNRHQACAIWIIYVKTAHENIILGFYTNVDT